MKEQCQWLKTTSVFVLFAILFSNCENNKPFVLSGENFSIANVPEGSEEKGTQFSVVWEKKSNEPGTHQIHGALIDFSPRGSFGGDNNGIKIYRKNLTNGHSKKPIIIPTDQNFFLSWIQDDKLFGKALSYPTLEDIDGEILSGFKPFEGKVINFDVRYNKVQDKIITAIATNTGFIKLYELNREGSEYTIDRAIFTINEDFSEIKNVCISYGFDGEFVYYFICWEVKDPDRIGFALLKQGETDPIEEGYIIEGGVSYPRCTFDAIDNKFLVVFNNGLVLNSFFVVIDGTRSIIQEIISSENLLNEPERTFVEKCKNNIVYDDAADECKVTNTEELDCVKEYGVSSSYRKVIDIAPNQHATGRFLLSFYELTEIQNRLNCFTPEGHSDRSRIKTSVHQKFVIHNLNKEGTLVGGSHGAGFDDSLHKEVMNAAMSREISNGYQMIGTESEGIFLLERPRSPLR